MPAPTNSPVVSSVPLYGPNYVMGEVTNQYQPTRVDSMQVVIPNSLLGNEAIAGYAAFTVDGVTVTRGVTSLTLTNFCGFFADYSFWEGNAGTNPYVETMGGTFLAPVCGIGSIYVYNSSAISPVVASGLKVVLVTTDAVNFPVGSVFQGSPGAVTGSLDISSQCFVKTAQTVVGAGVLLELVQK